MIAAQLMATEAQHLQIRTEHILHSTRSFTEGGERARLATSPGPDVEDPAAAARGSLPAAVMGIVKGMVGRPRASPCLAPLRCAAPARDSDGRRAGARACA